MELGRNRLLAAMSATSLERLRPKLSETVVERQRVLCQEATPVGHAHFPLSGWVSNVVLLTGRTAAEVGLIGAEGMVGLSILRGSPISFYRTMVQCQTLTAASISSSDLIAIFETDLEVRTLLLRYEEALSSHMAYTAACNGWHDVSKRLARWLLSVHDRAGGDDLPLTQEFLAMMLCVHRPRISRAAKLLQDAGIIDYRHGRIRVLDRSALEGRCCECYGLMNAGSARLIPFTASP
jgi:CRP-like cAMP-binding protein